MADNIIIKTITLTADWQAISETPLVVSAELSVPPGNAHNVTVRTSTRPADEAVWIPGEYHRFFRIDLSEFQVKGEPGETITVIGETE